MLPVHDERQARRVRRHRAARGSRAEKGLARAPGRRGALHGVSRSRRPPDAHTALDARSETNQINYY